MLQNGELGTTRFGPLPPEILAKIFLYCRRSQQTRLLIPPNRLPPVTLSHVCKLWNTICLDTPELWSDICTGYFGFRSAKVAEMIQTWSRRAEGYDIAIRHSPDLFGGMQYMVSQEDNRTYVQESRQLTSVISMLAPRIQRLELNVIENIVLNPILFLLGTGLWHNTLPDSPADGGGGDDSSASSYSDLDFTVSFPVLEVLEIRSGQLSPLANTVPTRDKLLTSLQSTCPRLRSVRLQWPGVSLGPQITVMRCMRSLDLEYCPSAEQALRWVDVCPNVKNLKVIIFGSEPDAEDPESDDDEEFDVDEETDDFDELEDELGPYDPDDPLHPEGYTEYDGIENALDHGDIILNTERLDRITLAGSDDGRSVADSIVEAHLTEKSTRKLIHLRNLDLTAFSSVVDIEAVFKAIEAPNLRCLKVSTYSTLRNRGRWVTIIGFLMRSGSAHRLLEFEASGTPMTPEDIRGCLSMMDNLRTLKLGKLNLNDGDALLRFLTVPLRSGRTQGHGQSNERRRRRRESSSRRSDAASLWESIHLCPKLESLDLTDASFNVDALAKMIQSRCDTMTYGTDFHKRQARFKLLKVSQQYLRPIRGHSKVAPFVNPGALKIREGEYNACLNVWGP